MQASDQGNALARFSQIPVIDLIPIAHCFLFIDQYTADPASPSNIASGHQLVSICWSVFDEEKSQSADLLLSSYYLSASALEQPFRDVQYF